MNGATVAPSKAPSPTPNAQTPPVARESGLHYMAQAAFWFAVMSLLVKFASATLPTMEIVLGRGCVALLLSTALLLRARKSPFRSDPRLLLLRGLFGSLALICFYAAVVHMPLAEATVIHQTAPLFTAVLAAWLLRERLEPRVLVAIGLCIAGVLLIAQPSWLPGFAAKAPGYPWQFAFLALLGAVLSAFAYVTVRRLGRSEDPLVVVFYFPLVTVPLVLPFAVPVWVWPSTTGWLLLLGIGITTQIAQIAMTKGLAREPAGRATTVGYLQVAFATVAGAVAFGAWPNAWSWGGMGLILLSLLASTRAWRR